MKLYGSYDKTYTAKSGKSSKDNKFHTILERQKAIGSKLSFAAAEAYKLLRTNIFLSMSDDVKCKIIGITSALRGEGKTSTAINLAYSFAEANKEVLLIEADMRIPVTSKTLGIKDTPGLSNVLAGVSQLDDAIRPAILLKDMSFLPAGDIPPNPSELLSSPRMEQLLKVLSKSFDYIILDLPPVNAVSDSLAVSKLLNGMVIVVRQNYCDRNSLTEALRQLSFLKVRLLGFVMTDAGSSSGSYKKYRYKSRYGYKGKHYYGYRHSSENKMSADKKDAAEKTGG